MSIASGNDAPLEIITAGIPSRQPALLFVHGGLCGAWVWSERFLPFFADAGWHCIAVSLRGHGHSPGREQLDWFGVADYVADAAMAAAGLDHPPVVIGHSMGGMIAQHFVQKHVASGLVLLASISPAGLARPLAQMYLRHPNLLWELNRVQTFGPEAANYEVIRRGLFCADFPVDLAWRYRPLFQRESLRATLELMVPQWFYLMRRRRLPALVLGGANDWFIPYADLEASSVFWNAEIHVLEDAPHAMMLDLSWRVAAEIIAGWLGRMFDRK